MKRADREERCTEAQMRRIAASQQGLITRDQALRAGLSSAAVHRRISSGVWERVLPRVFRIAGVPPNGCQAALAACLWAGPQAVVSHAAAAVLWGLEGVQTRRIEITVPAGRAPSSPLVVVHRSLTLTHRDRAELARIPVTSPSRTMVDLAACIDGEPLETAMESGMRRGLFTAMSLRRRLDAIGGQGRPGSAELRRLLEQRGERSRSLEYPLEVKVWRMLVRSGLPRPVRQHAVEVDGHRYRLDFAWPGFAVAVEADGFASHGGRLAFHADRRRIAGLLSAGWRVVPVTWQDVTERPHEWLTRLARTLARAA